MPLTQPRRRNPLMRSYFEAIGLSNQALAEVCGVSRSQIHMARERNVGADNAEKIASGIAKRLGLLPEDRLLLKAEIMGHPENLVRAHLGSGADAARLLGEGEDVGKAVVGAGEVPRTAGLRVLGRLEGMGAPARVVEGVRSRLAPEYVPVGRVTHRQSGLEARNRRAAGLFRFRAFKPKTADAMGRAGLTRTEIRKRAGVAKETLRGAMFERCGEGSAAKIAGALGDELGLSGDERGAIREELVTVPPKNFAEISRT